MNQPPIATTATAVPSVTSDRLRALIAEELPGLIEFRHDLHAHPETMYEEHRTAARVKEELAAAGIDHLGNLAGGTGVLGFLPGADTSRGAVALRADIDALPIQEESDLPYASKIPGRMHACGHDGHTTMLLGAARVLQRLAADAGARPGLLPRPVKLVFQPAEEGGAGGKRMVEDGCLTDATFGVAVDEMYGMHCWPPLEVGQVATRVGPLMASADLFEITITGRGTHAAFPHTGRDPVLAASAVVQALQSIVSRNVDPVDSIVVSVTMFHAGTAKNIIPDAARLAGTLRALSPEMRAFAMERIRSIVSQTAAAYDCRGSITFGENGYPVTANHPQAVERFHQFARGTVGATARELGEWPMPVMGGEDFAFYCREVPSCFFFLGQQPEGASEPYPMVHTPVFNFNDDTIALGVELFCRIALEMTN